MVQTKSNRKPAEGSGTPAEHNELGPHQLKSGRAQFTFGGRRTAGPILTSCSWRHWEPLPGMTRSHGTRNEKMAHLNEYKYSSGIRKSTLTIAANCESQPRSLDRH